MRSTFETAGGTGRQNKTLDAQRRHRNQFEQENRTRHQPALRSFVMTAFSKRQG